MERNWQWTRLAAIGVAVGVLLAGIACGDDDMGDDDNDSGASSADQAVGVPAAGGVPGESGPNPPASNILDRKIIFSAQMTLSVENISNAFSDVTRLATGAGGYVEGSSFTNADDPQARTALLTLRVPADRYQDTLAGLRSLTGGSVKSESSKSSEVTEEYTDLQSRQRNLERTEQQYLALLGQAATITDILIVQDRLDGVRGQIEQIQGRLNALDDLADLATIDVTLTPVPPLAANGGSDGPKPVIDAFVDAWAWFTEASGYVLVGVAVVAVAAIFLALPAGIVLAVMLVVRRVRAPGTLST
ncbi:MAG: DUF4349 domain-containing protein [Dehalococcoidia bacterium]